MAVFRLLLLLALVASAISFIAYALSGQVRFRKLGLRLLLAAIAAGLVFFAVLIAENVMSG